MQELLPAGPGNPLVEVREPRRACLRLQVIEPLEIGRDCTGLLLSDPAISRRHLLVEPLGSDVLVTDLGSRNGSTVDGHPLSNRHRLQPDQVVRFGACSLGLLAPAGHPRAGGRASADAAAATSIGLLAEAVLEGGVGAPPPGDAGTLTIVFSDIEASTARAVELGDVRWHEVLAVHNQIARRMLVRHHGTESHSLGDGFMMCFRSARSALSYVIDLQRALAAYERANPLAGLRVRMGVHTGEALLDDGDLFGRHVIMASRIADQAKGGEILVSSLVREIVASRGDVVFGETRTAELKGLDGIHSMHQVIW